MKTPSLHRQRGFTLLETVIAIGVLAVLLTGFMIVFAPAAAGIRKSINIQEADRLASTLEQELVTLRPGQQPTTAKTGFAKAFEWIRGSDKATDALMIYQYRGSMTSLRPDGTPEPVPNINNKVPGKDYTVQTMVRSLKDNEAFKKDLTAVEGSVYFVKCTQLIFKDGALTTPTPPAPGKILDPKPPNTEAATPDDYPEAVIAFSGEFFAVPTKSAAYFDSRFSEYFTKAKNPVFTRNLAVRR
jgi:prepilin-type N-terminal cleavage/methylation domain-containing protein